MSEVVLYLQADRLAWIDAREEKQQQTKREKKKERETPRSETKGFTSYTNSSIQMYWFSRASITKNHLLGGLTYRNLLSYGSSG